MGTRGIERRLKQVGKQLTALRTDLAVAEEQLVHLAEDADDARLRALVSETPGSDHTSRDAARHAEAMQRHRDRLVEEIVRLEQAQDELLDDLNRARA